MYDELTEVDIKKMEEEIRYRFEVLGPQLLKEMARTREFGDLSENAEYKEARDRLREQASTYGGGYRRSGTGGCDLCTNLICADCCCEMMGGDLIPCC